MRHSFPLFNTPIDLLHSFFPKILEDGDTAIDATAGKGRDSLALANVLKKHKNTNLIVIDLQTKALEETKLLLQEHVSDYLSSVTFILGSHEKLPEVIPKLIVYNLGYLPGGDKTVTTKTSSTLSSIKNALDILPFGGVLSITCYPGHEEGAKELKTLEAFCKALSPSIWSVSITFWQNRTLSPALILVQKALA